MGNINGFKLINQKSDKYFDLLEKELNQKIELKKESDKCRFGFYLYILECITGIKDLNQLIEMITDTDFNKTIFKKNDDDNGIDAVFIDKENQEINLFNFKYRENFNLNGQELNNVMTSTKFTSALLNNNPDHLKGRLKNYAKKIIENLQSNDIWKLTLYIISNENKGLDINNPIITQLKELYDLEIKSIIAKDIVSFMSLRPESISAKLVLNKDSILSYSESSLSSAKSYIIRLSITELIRITCNNPELRNQYNLENYAELYNQELDSAILFDNVRGFLGKTKYNNNILRTLKESPEKFFMYNNGLTVTAEEIISDEINAKQKIKLDIKNLQIVNGGQTLRIIYDFNALDKNNIVQYLSSSEVLLRIFKTNPSSDLTNKIAEYTNSQNAISVIDLKSLAYEQLEIERFLDENNIIYARKIGDTGLSKDKNYEHKITLEKFGQILFSINGNPEKASNQKKKIFEKHYEETFGENNFDITQSAIIIREYFAIKTIFKSDFPNINVTDQKIFYILYLNRKRKNDIKDNITFLDKCLSEYKNDKNLAPARKLIEKEFKILIDAKN